jgi:ectoine hydroxylase-related dioxygenase (phytanoyl-CoA dioxygenase family)/tellurite resistance-related uncharacterized protein
MFEDVCDYVNTTYITMNAPNRRPSANRPGIFYRHRYAIGAVVIGLVWLAFVYQNSSVYCVGGMRACAAQGHYRALLDRKSFACASKDPIERSVEDTPAADTSNAWHDDFHTYGASAPFKVFNTKQEANELADIIIEENAKYKKLMDPITASKAYGYMRSPSVLKLAHSPLLLARVQSLLGDDFILFENDIVLRQPGVVHRYHSDASFVGCPAEDAVAVWVALRAVSCATTLEVLPFSHRLDITAQDYLSPQQVGVKIGVANMSIHAAAAERASQLVTEKFGNPGDPPIKFVRMDVVDGEAIMFHPNAWHGSANVLETGGDTGPARLALAIRYMRASCQPRAKSDSPPYTFAPQLPPVVYVHGTLSADQKETLNLYTWGGSTVVAGKTPFHLLTHRYTPIVSNAKTMSINVDGVKKSATPVTQDQAHIFEHPEVNWKAEKMTMYKTEPVTVSTDRLASLEMHWTFQPQYGAPDSAMGRHASEDLTVLLAGELRFTHLIHDGTFVRETLVSQPGSLSMIDTMVWHKTTAMSAEGALYFAINYITRADLDGPITEHAKDLCKLYDPSISELTGPGIVFPYPTKGAVVASGRSVRVTTLVIPKAKDNFRQVVPPRQFDILLVMLSGTLKVEGSSLGAESTHVLKQHDVMLIPSDASITLATHKSLAAEFELFEFRGPAYGDSEPA